MNLYDIINLFIILAATFISVYRGFSISSIKLVTLLCIITITIILLPYSYDVLSEYIKNELLVNILSLVLSYLIARISCKWISNRITEPIEKKGKGFVDRVLGFWLGIVEGFTVILIFFMIIGIFSSPSTIKSKNYWQVLEQIDSNQYPKWIKKSICYKHLSALQDMILQYLDNSFVSQYFQKFEINIPDNENEEKNEENNDNEIIDKVLEELETVKKEPNYTKLHSNKSSSNTKFHF